METQIRGPASAMEAGTTGTSPAQHLRPAEQIPENRAMTT